MQITYNKPVEITGNLTRNAEHRICRNGSLMTYFCMGVRQVERNAQGQYITRRTIFQNVLVFGVLTELADWLTKGEFVKVQGKMAKFDSGDNYVMIADSIRSLWRPGMPKKFDIDELSKLQ